MPYLRKTQVVAADLCRQSTRRGYQIQKLSTASQIRAAVSLVCGESGYSRTLRCSRANSSRETKYWYRSNCQEILRYKSMREGVGRRYQADRREMRDGRSKLRCARSRARPANAREMGGN